jgi:hypothetical protein
MKKIEFEDALVVDPAKVSVLDEMPVGTVVDFEGDEIPAGWEEVENPDVYSTEETFTGKYWIDGKKIYRKVITGTLPANEGWVILFKLNIPNYNSIIASNFQFENSSGAYYKAPFFEGDDYYTLYSIEKSQNFYVKVKGFNSLPFIVVLEYTKTTE